MKPIVDIFDCRVLLCPETEDGATGFSVHALELPGVVSEGDTEEEALANIQEALAGAIKAYRELGEIPWAPVAVEPCVGACECRVQVHA